VRCEDGLYSLKVADRMRNSCPTNTLSHDAKKTALDGLIRPLVLKITQHVLTRYENPALNLILQPFARNEF
jgi:hypothetical protein